MDGAQQTGGEARPILIAGSSGMLGTSLRLVAGVRGVDFEAPGESDFDVTHESAVRRVMDGFAMRHPGGLVVNAAAYTNVERAEDDRSRAFLVNEDGARSLAAASRDRGLGFVHVSTDFVFNGTKAGPYVETDDPAPLSVYGASKLAGERAVADEYPEALVVRTAWVFGPAGINFPVKILRAAAEHREIRGVTDECGSPTYTVDLAGALLDLAASGACGLFHLAGAGEANRYELARETLRLGGYDAQVEPVLSATFPSRVARPANSVLDCSKAEARGVVMPDWRDGLARFVEALS